MHVKLMIPGPIEVEREVLDALAEPVVAHYGDEWLAVHNETIGLLQQVIGTAGKQAHQVQVRRVLRCRALTGQSCPPRKVADPPAPGAWNRPLARRRGASAPSIL